MKKACKEQSTRLLDSGSEPETKGWKASLIHEMFYEPRSDAQESPTIESRSPPHSTRNPPGQVRCSGLLSQFIDSQLKAVKLCFSTKTPPDYSHVIRLVSDQLRVGSKLAELYGGQSQTDASNNQPGFKEEEGVEVESSLILPDFTSTHLFIPEEGERSSPCLNNLNAALGARSSLVQTPPPKLQGGMVETRWGCSSPALMGEPGSPDEREDSCQQNPKKSPEVYRRMWPNSRSRSPERHRKPESLAGFFNDSLFGVQSRKNSYAEFMEEEEELRPF